MRLALLSVALSVLICTGFIVSQDLRSRNTAPVCTSEIKGEQLRDIRTTVRHLTTKWTSEDARLLDVVSVVMAEKLGIRDLPDTQR